MLNPINLIKLIRKYLARFILQRILGWSILDDQTKYDSLRKGKHIVTYTHTGDYEIIIGCLLALACELPVVVVARKDLGKLPIIPKILSMMIDIIILNDKNKKEAPSKNKITEKSSKDDEKAFVTSSGNTTLTDFITDELKKRQSFLLLITPEGTRKRVDDLRPGFYNIAQGSQADIIHLSIDFENHTTKIKEIANDAVVQTSSYDKIKKFVEDEIKKDRPYKPEYCHLVDPATIGKTSFVNIDKSLIIYIPPLIVLITLINIFHKSFFFY